MSTIPVLFGTESGNAELVADDITEALFASGIPAKPVSMEDHDVENLVSDDVIVVVTSTYGEGELPATTEPFRQALVTAAPDLTGLRFAAFGLGDSSYETYNNAIVVLAAELTARGAEQVGPTGRHDALSGESFTDVASSWARALTGVLAPVRQPGPDQEVEHP